jgi:cytochrome P450
MSSTQFNYTDASFMLDPYPALAQMRRATPVYCHTDSNLWSVFRYHDIRRLLQDSELFSSVVDDGLPRTTAGRSHSLSAIDPPDHTRLRAVISDSFRPKLIETLSKGIRDIVTRLVNEVLGDAAVEFVQAFSFHLPMTVTTEMLGLPHDDSAQLRRWSDDLGASQFRGLGGQEIPADLVASRQKALAELEPYFRQAIMERKSAPRDDLISVLLRAEENGEVRSLIELVSTIGLVLIAGMQTTQHLISNAIVLLAERPELQKRLRADASLIPPLIEEVLRFESPVTARLRRATKDLKIGGVPIPKDATILWWISSANRDEAAFPDPDTFNPTRHPNHHLAFGHGAHFCLGAGLSRMEARIAVEELLARTESFRLVGEGPWIRSEHFGFRGAAKLPVELYPPR